MYGSSGVEQRGIGGASASGMYEITYHKDNQKCIQQWGKLGSWVRHSGESTDKEWGANDHCSRLSEMVQTWAAAISSLWLGFTSEQPGARHFLGS